MVAEKTASHPLLSEGDSFPNKTLAFVLFLQNNVHILLDVPVLWTQLVFLPLQAVLPELRARLVPTGLEPTTLGSQLTPTDGAWW